mgnify:CR=1 FL=1
MTDCTYAVFTAVRFGLISVEIPIRGDLLFRESVRNPLLIQLDECFGQRILLTFFVLVHGNIPKLIVIQRGICFSYEYRFCLVDKCINYVFLKKIKCHKNRVGGTCSKYLLLLYSENNQFISYLPQPPGQQQVWR